MRFLSELTSIKTVEKGSNNQEKAKISLVASHHLELILSCSESLSLFYFSFSENISLLQIGPPLSDFFFHSLTIRCHVLKKICRANYFYSVLQNWAGFTINICTSLSWFKILRKKSEIVTTFPCPCVLCPNQFPNVSLAVFTTDSWERSSWLWRGSELHKINCWIFDSVFSVFIIHYHSVISTVGHLIVQYIYTIYYSLYNLYRICIFHIWYSIFFCIIGTQTTSSYLILYFLYSMLNIPYCMHTINSIFYI